MDDERSQEHGERRQQESKARYERARGGSFEGERSAQLSHELQTLQNHMDRLERRVSSLEDEVAALRRGEHDAST